MLNEIDAKALLRRHGIATTNPTLATTAAEAAAHARRGGGPFALKIVSPQIVHKAAAGGVALNVPADAAEAAFGRILQDVARRHPEAELAGVLIEEIVPPGLEIFIGARFDNDFGAVVLLGFGGANVERGLVPGIALAPIDAAQAERLIDTALGDALDSTCGPSARPRIVDYLLAVAGPGGLLETAWLSELDINPIIVTPQAAVAVDAVVKLRGDSLPAHDASLDARLARRRAGLAGLGALFDPVSVAVVGASSQPDKLGYRIIRNMLDFGFKGPIHPIHPSASEILGLRAWPTVDAVPGPVDRAFITVKAEQVAGVLAACGRKGVKVAQVLTAGFSEWSGEAQTADGAVLEAAIGDALAGSPTRMVGPNCIGTFSASGRLSFGAPRNVPTAPGGITFISQSGTFAGDVIRRAKCLGLPVGRVLSCGNCTDLDPIDYLLFCEDDPSTTLTAFYVESIREPGLFFRLAARARKPIVIFKGGTTAQGIRAATSHTAALATDRALWSAAADQPGVVVVDSVDALLDTFLLFAAHGSLPGHRLGIFGSGGGVSVTAAEAAARAGLTVPPLATGTARALARFGVPGTSVSNPIDIPVWGLKDGNRYILEDMVNLLKADGGLDTIIVYVEMGSVVDFAPTDAEGLRQLDDICASIARADRHGPKVTVALRTPGSQGQDDFVRAQRLRLLEQGIAVFPTTTRAVQAQARLLQLSKPARRTALRRQE